MRLTPTEYELLFELSVHAGRVLTHDQLLQRVWGLERTGEPWLVREVVKRLRRKLGDDAGNPAYIPTEPRVRRCRVIVTTDSKYVVDSMSQGWAENWRANGWRRGKREKALNPDLWTRLLDAASRHDVTFEWVRGHAGHAENERCDRLANEAARGTNLVADEEYERRRDA